MTRAETVTKDIVAAGGWSFRFAQRSDVGRVTEFINRTYHGEEASRGWTPETHLHAGPRTSVSDVEAYVRDPNSRFLLCEGPQGLIGCALIQHQDGEGYLSMFAVDTRSQGGGWGKAILAEAERCVATLWNCRALAMSVISLQAALIAFYERRGYRRTGTRAPFPFDQAPGALRRDYDLVVMRKQF